MKCLPLLLVTLFSCNCATVREDIIHREAVLRSNIKNSTVLLHIQLELVPPIPLKASFDRVPTVFMEKSCSGVIVAKSSNLFAPRTLIVTANHCLDNPRLGETTEDGARVLSVSMMAYDAYGARCNFKTVKLGGPEADDVATAVSACDLGSTATLATKVPSVEEMVYISGHPSGVYPGIITSGSFAGWMDGYLLLSAPAHGGNSGGPVLDSDGRVVGILVRGSDEYEHITLAAPLGEIKARVRASASWMY